MLLLHVQMCLISDRHAGLLQSILKLQRETATTPPLWPDVQNRWCIRHMGANFYDHFKNKDLKNMFKRLCTQNQQRKFNALWQMFDQLTAELVKVRASGKARIRLQRLGIQLRNHFHTGFEVHLRRNGHSFMIPTEYGMVFRQRTMQSVSIWLCVLVVPFLLWELLSSSCMGA